MPRSHKTRNGQRAPYTRLVAWWFRRARNEQRERSAPPIERTWDERWPW